VNQSQLYLIIRWEPQAAGRRKFGWTWPIPLFTGASPQGDNQKAMEVIDDLGGVGAASPFQSATTAAGFADYCKVGPLGRLCYVPEAKLAEAKARAAHWKTLNEKYRLGRGRAFPYCGPN